MSTNIYGTREDFVQITDEMELHKYFQPNGIKLKRGESFIFSPALIHSGPEIEAKPRIILYLEFHTSETAIVEYKTELVNEINKSDMMKRDFKANMETQGWKYQLK